MNEVLSPRPGMVFAGFFLVAPLLPALVASLPSRGPFLGQTAPGHDVCEPRPMDKEGKDAPGILPGTVCAKAPRPRGGRVFEEWQGDGAVSLGAPSSGAGCPHQLGSPSEHPHPPSHTAPSTQPPPNSPQHGCRPGGLCSAVPHSPHCCGSFRCSFINWFFCPWDDLIST